MTHHFGCRVYYEDTDMAGIVYYANYLRFIERARTEWARHHGIDQKRLRAEVGIVFAVRRVEADFIAPAVFDDMLDVATTVQKATGARIVLNQEVTRGSEMLFSAQVTLVALAANGAPSRIPAVLRSKLA